MSLSSSPSHSCRNTANIDSSLISNWDDSRIVPGSPSFSESFLQHLLTAPQLSHLDQCIRSWQERSISHTPNGHSIDWDPMHCDLNDLSVDERIIQETQLILVKILFAMEFQNCEGVILISSCASCVENSSCCSYDSHSGVDDRGGGGESTIVAMELLSQLKYNGGSSTSKIDQSRGEPIIRILFAMAPTVERALMFLRDVNKDQVKVMRVSSACCQSCHQYEGEDDSSYKDTRSFLVGSSRSSGGSFSCKSTTSRSSTRITTTRDDFWIDWTQKVMRPLVSGGGLLDAPSGLKVHEGILFPVRCYQYVSSNEDHQQSMIQVPPSHRQGMISDFNNKDELACCVEDWKQEEYEQEWEVSAAVTTVATAFTASVQESRGGLGITSGNRHVNDDGKDSISDVLGRIMSIRRLLGFMLGVVVLVLVYAVTTMVVRVPGSLGGNLDSTRSRIQRDIANVVKYFYTTSNTNIVNTEILYKNIVQHFDSWWKQASS